MQQRRRMERRARELRRNRAWRSSRCSSSRWCLTVTTKVMDKMIMRSAHLILLRHLHRWLPTASLRNSPTSKWWSLVARKRHPAREQDEKSRSRFTCPKSQPTLGKTHSVAQWISLIKRIMMIRRTTWVSLKLKRWRHGQPRSANFTERLFGISFVF